MDELVPYTMYTEGGEMDGGKYRTKKASTKSKAKKSFIKSLVKKGYSEQYAKMAFGKEEKNKRKIKSTKSYKGKGKKGGVREKQIPKIMAQAEKFRSFIKTFQKGGVYRTKKAGTKELAMDAFVKSLEKKGYSKKGAKMLFSKEEKKPKLIKNTRGYVKGKKAVPAQLKPWLSFLKMHPFKKAKAEDPKLTYAEYRKIMSKAYNAPEKKKA